MNMIPWKHTDLSLSPISFGAMRYIKGGVDESRATQLKNAEAITETALELGINLFDHADIYGGGQCEALFGELLSQHPDWRERMIIQTKCGIQSQRYNHNPQYILDCIDRSLRRLKTEQIDVFLLHRPDPLVDPQAVAAAFDQVRAAGKVRYFGVSNYSKAQMELLQSACREPLVANQIQLSLLHPWPISEGVFVNRKESVFTGVEGLVEHCRLTETQIQAWSPVAGGGLSLPGEQPDAHSDAVRATLGQLSKEMGHSPETIGLAWIMKHPAAIIPVIGTQSPKRLRAMMQAGEIDLSDERWWKLFHCATGRQLP